MVAPKADQPKKKVGNKSGNARKGKPIMKNRVRRPPINHVPLGAMFNPNQMSDNPGYMDFNEPVPGVPPPHAMNLRSQPPIPVNRPQKSSPNTPSPAQSNTNKKSRAVNRRQQQRRRQILPGGWGPMAPPPPNMSPIPPMLNNRGGPFRGPLPPPRMHPMMAMGRPPMPPLMPPPPINGRFGPRPMLPPPLMGRPPHPGMPLPRPPLGMPLPPPPRPLLAPRNANPIGGSPIRRTKTNRRNNRNNKKNKAKKPNAPGTAGASNTAGPHQKKSILNKPNQYALDKPWVNDEIKEACKKKEDLETKLKGNRNDQLFAEFKIQRDKFVTMYEAARLEFIGKHPEKDVEKIMTESDKRETQTSNNTKNVVAS